jgi:archaemetzincin
VVVGLGGVGGRLLGGVREALRAAYALDVVAGAPLTRPQYAFNEARRQHHAASILRRLAGPGGPGERLLVVGVADVDLFLPEAAFVLGDADRAVGAAVVSTARLGSRDPLRVEARASVEAVHQAGHLLGLGHCPDLRCAMYLARVPGEVDRKGASPCGGCLAALDLPSP